MLNKIFHLLRYYCKILAYKEADLKKYHRRKKNVALSFSPRIRRQILTKSWALFIRDRKIAHKWRVVTLIPCNHKASNIKYTASCRGNLVQKRSASGSATGSSCGYWVVRRWLHYAPQYTHQFLFSFCYYNCRFQ